MLAFLENLLIGAIAGVIASRFTQPSERDLSLSILLGIAGALVGSQLAEVLNISILGQYRDQITATVGAIFFLIGWRQTRP